MLRILLAEDNDLVRDSLKLLLGYEHDIEIVGDAADGQEALDLLQRIEVDLVVTDLNMPKVDGFQLIEELKKRNPDIQILVYSALDSTTHVARAFRIGASAYLTKDSSAEELIFALRHVSQEKKYLSADLSISMFEKHHQFD